jgi:hypothetical protein
LSPTKINSDDLKRKLKNLETDVDKRKYKVALKNNRRKILDEFFFM